MVERLSKIEKAPGLTLQHCENQNEKQCTETFTNTTCFSINCLIWEGGLITLVTTLYIDKLFLFFGGMGLIVFETGSQYTVLLDPKLAM